MLPFHTVLILDHDAQFGCNTKAKKNLYLLYISAPVTNERNTCSAFVFTGFPTYAGGGRKIGGESGRRHKGENKIKTAPANGCEVREKSTRKAGLMVWRR